VCVQRIDQDPWGVYDTALVVVPYLIVFGCFSVRARFGTFAGNIFIQMPGLLLMLFSTVGYIVSILYLRRNWAVSAAIKVGHTLVTNVPTGWSGIRCIFS